MDGAAAPEPDVEPDLEPEPEPQPVSAAPEGGPALAPPAGADGAGTRPGPKGDGAARGPVALPKPQRRAVRENIEAVRALYLRLEAVRARMED